MELNLRQKNNLLTGVILAQELEPIIEDTRRFITVRSLRKSPDGKLSTWGKKIPSDEDFNSAVYFVKVYSVRSDLMEYDLLESQLSEYSYFEIIETLESLYSILSGYMNDCDSLVPQWDCDNPLE